VPEPLRKQPIHGRFALPIFHSSRKTPEKLGKSSGVSPFRRFAGCGMSLALLSGGEAETREGKEERGAPQR
jgi:hypothetical protein